MKKTLFIISIVALVVCNFYIIESDKDISKVSLDSIVSIAQAEDGEEPLEFYTVQVCYECEPAPGQAGVTFECWYFEGDSSQSESCFNLSCGYGLC